MDYGECSANEPADNENLSSSEGSNYKATQSEPPAPDQSLHSAPRKCSPRGATINSTDVNGNQEEITSSTTYRVYRFGAPSSSPPKITIADTSVLTSASEKSGSPTAIHCGYFVESSMRTSSPQLLVSHTQSQRPNFSTFGYEKVLGEIHQRCQNSDEINKDLERKLELKNKELYQNCALLERSQETLARLQRQLQEERHEKAQLKAQHRELGKELREAGAARDCLDLTIQELHISLHEVNSKLEKRQRVIELLQNDKQEFEDKIRSLERSLKVKEDEHYAQAMLLEQLNGEKEELARRLGLAEGTAKVLQQQAGDQTEEVLRLKSQLAKEEKANKHLEKEVDLITQQGQSLIEQQAATKIQYQDDIQALKVKVKELEGCINEKDAQIKDMTNALKHVEQQSQDSQLYLNARNSDLSGQLDNLQQQLDDQIEGERKNIESLTAQLRSSCAEKKRLEVLTRELNDEKGDLEQQLTSSRHKLCEENESKKEHLELLTHKADDAIQELIRERSGFIQKEKLLSETHLAEILVLKNNFEKESINFKCRIAELEELLDNKDNVLATLGETLKEATERETRALNAYNELLADYHAQCQEEEDEMTKNVNNTSRESIRLETPERTGAEIETGNAGNSSLTAKCAIQEKEILDLRSELEVAKKLAVEVTTVRALLSKKESSKSILVAEQKRIEREYSIILSQKDSVINNLEKELRAHQNGVINQKLAKRDSRDTVAVQTRLTRDQSIMTVEFPQSIAFMEAETLESKQEEAVGVEHDISHSQSLIARKHSSKEILKADVSKLKQDVHQSELWWQRDLNEMQRRYAAQTSQIIQMEREMTELELENSTLKEMKRKNKRKSCFECEKSGSVVSTTQTPSNREAGLAAYESLLDHYKKEISLKDSKIQNLKSSLQTLEADMSAVVSETEKKTEVEGEFRFALESKVVQYEGHIRQIFSHLQEAGKALEKKDNKAAQNILRKSSNQLEILAKHIKSLTPAWSNNCEISRDGVATQQQKSEQDSLKQCDAQAKHLESLLEVLLSSKNQEIHEQQREIEALQQKIMFMESAQRECSVHMHQAHADIDNVELSKTLLQARLKQAEEQAAKAMKDANKHIAKLRAVKGQLIIAHEQEMIELRSRFQTTDKTLRELHEKEITIIHQKLTESEKRNSELQSEANRLQEKLFAGSKDLEGEITEMHGRLQRVTAEKTELIDTFKLQLSILKQENENILAESAAEALRLNNRLAETLSQRDVIKEECFKQKESCHKIREEIQMLKTEFSKEREMLKSCLENKETEKVNLLEAAENNKKQISHLLDSITKAEIENVKLSNQIKQMDKSAKEAENHLRSHTEKLANELNIKTAQYNSMLNEQKQLRASMKTVEHQLNSAEETISLIRTDLKHAESINNMYKERLTLLETKLLETECSVEKLKNNAVPMEPLKENPTLIGDKLLEFTIKLAEQKMENERQRIKLASVETQLKDHQQKCSRMETTSAEEKVVHAVAFNKLQAQFVESQSQLHEKTQEMGHLLEQIESLKLKLQNKTKESSDFQLKIRESKLLEQKYHAAVRQERDLQLSIEELTAQLTRTEAISRSYEQKFKEEANRLKADMCRLQAQLNQSHRANRSLESYVHAIRASFGRIFTEIDADIEDEGL